MTRPRIGIALGSGSARGWAHIGVLDALIEADIEPDIVCGASIGALVGAAYVAGSLPTLREWAESATWREIMRLLDVRLSGGGLIEGGQICNFLGTLGISQPIESYARKYTAVATDLATGREVWLQSGPIHEAVRASIALPGILSPTRHGERWLVDGGLTNPVPVSVCRALGADIIIAVNLNGELLGRRFENGPEISGSNRNSTASREFVSRLLDQIPTAFRSAGKEISLRLLRHAPPTPGYFDVLANSINIMQDQITRTRLAGEPPHVLLLPHLRDMRLLDYTRAREAIAAGRTCVEEAMPVLQRFVHG